MDDALKALLEQAPGAWKVLDAPAGLLLALRDRGGGLYAEASRLGAGRPSMAGDLAEVQPSDLLNFLHQGRRTGVLLTPKGGTRINNA